MRTTRSRRGRIGRWVAATFVCCAIVAVLGSASSANPGDTTAATQTLGTSVIGAGHDSNPAGRAEAFRVVAPIDGSLLSINVYLDAATTATSVDVGLYADSAGSPGTLVADGVLTAPTPGAWNTVSIPSSSVASGASYWIAFVGVGGTVAFRDGCCGTGGTSPSELSAATTLTALPQTWTTGTRYAHDGPVAAYATVTGSVPTVIAGDPIVEPQVDKNAAGLAEAFKQVAATDGTLTAVRLYLDPSSTSTSVKVGVYADAGGHPGSRLGLGTISAPKAGAWNTAWLPPIAVTHGEPYWLAILGAAGAGQIVFRDHCCGGNGPNPSETSAQTALADLPAQWTTGRVFRSDGPASLYAPESLVASLSVSVRVGNIAELPLPAPISGLDSVSQKSGDAESRLGVSVDTSPDSISIDAPTSASTGEGATTIEGNGCTDTTCGLPFVLSLDITVGSAAVPDAAPLTIADPSPDRVAAGTPLDGGGVELGDELLVIVGTTDSPGTRADADAIAADVGAVVSGGVQDAGVFALRWPTSQDINARIAQLEALPNVVSAVPSTVGAYSPTTTLPPGDWNDDGPDATWPFAMLRTAEAWDITKGTSTKVGIVDGNNVFAAHEDLNVVKTVDSTPFDLTQASDESHATHVAGLACARANGIGLVGAAWGCPIVTGAIGGQPSWGAVTSKVFSVAFDVAQQGAKVINMSLGHNWYILSGGRTINVCATQAQHAAWNAIFQQEKPLFDWLYNLFPDVVWTVSAGNSCSNGVDSPWALAAAGRSNVLTVGAVNSDGNLASFSDFGPNVKVAAPGGVRTASGSGIWSTVWKNCGFLHHSMCSSYGTMSGTSMAAPLVAGVAALVRAAHPGFNASQVGDCILRSASTLVPSRDNGTPGGFSQDNSYSGTLGIVDAYAAVQCAPPTPAPGQCTAAPQISSFSLNPTGGGMGFSVSFRAFGGNWSFAATNGAGQRINGSSVGVPADATTQNGFFNAGPVAGTPYTASITVTTACGSASASTTYGSGSGGGGTPMGFHIEDDFLGGTWARTDPNDGTWYDRNHPPANAAYWYPNGLGIAVDCARAAAPYVVRFADGHYETWNVWFHVTDGKWYPSAATQEVFVNSFYGLPGC